MGHGRLGIMQIVFEWVAQRRNVFVLGRGDNAYQFVHSDDLADACLRAAGRPGFAVYNIGAEHFGTMRETLEGLVRHAGTGSKVRSLPYRPAVAAMKLTNRLGISPLASYHWLVYGQNVAFDIARAKAELGWSPRWSNVEMFIQSYDWYLENRARILAEKGHSPHRSAVKEGVLKLLRWL
jgi:nucleoside-diphosphate-sugar epimerase